MEAQINHATRIKTRFEVEGSSKINWMTPKLIINAQDFIEITQQQPGEVV